LFFEVEAAFFMRVSFSLLALTGLTVVGGSLLPVMAREFFELEGMNPIDPLDLVAQPQPEPVEKPMAILTPEEVRVVPEPPAAELPKPKLKVVPSIVRTITGEASWYGPGFYGNHTASGEVYRRGTMTAAHRTLPFGTKVRVTNLWNGRSAVIRINDRGPFVAHRVIDLGHGAASSLGVTSSGIAQVRLEVLR